MERGFLLLGALSAVLVVSGCVSGTGPEETGTVTGNVYGLVEVALHSTEGDCWLVIAGKVYDVTDWIPSHPGGEAILEGCGTDATDMFETRPMGSGTPHSQRARNLLEGYYIGDLDA